MLDLEIVEVEALAGTLVRVGRDHDDPARRRPRRVARAAAASSRNGAEVVHLERHLVAVLGDAPRCSALRPRCCISTSRWSCRSRKPLANSRTDAKLARSSVITSTASFWLRLHDLGSGRVTACGVAGCEHDVAPLRREADAGLEPDSRVPTRHEHHRHLPRPYLWVAQGSPQTSVQPTTSAANLSLPEHRRRLTPHAARHGSAAPDSRSRACASAP